MINKQHKPRIVFTGGGSAGHVTPNLALIERLAQENWQIIYIGSRQGIEKTIIKSLAILYYGIYSGKLRRYFSWLNLIEPIKVLLGFWQAFFLLRQLKPQILFSKGGFVAFPVVVAAWANRIPVVAHESDLTPGLANRLSFPFVSKLCLSFSVTQQYFTKKDKLVFTGTPIRSQLLRGEKIKGLDFCGFNRTLPCVLVMGGSQGSNLINETLRQALPILCEDFVVIHLCGRGKLAPNLNNFSNYYQVEYADLELPDLLAAADLIISRAGANSLHEILVLKKPHILIPLSLTASRGDQLLNAQYYAHKGVSTVLDEQLLTKKKFCSAIHTVYADRARIINKISTLGIESATTKIIGCITKVLHGNYCNKETSG